MPARVYIHTYVVLLCCVYIHSTNIQLEQQRLLRCVVLCCVVAREEKREDKKKNQNSL